MADGKPARVYVAEVRRYDHDAIRAAVERGLRHVRPEIGGNAVAKANWVFARPGLSPAAYTRPELVHSALDALLEADPDLYVLFAGNAGLGVSTRRMARAARGTDPLFRRRGFWALPRLHRGRVAIRPTDETRYYRYQLSVGRALTSAERADPDSPAPAEARWWERVVTGWEMYWADSVILFPKLKTNVLSAGLSGAVELQGMGLLRDSDKLDGHDWNNPRRMADMLEVSDPDLVITDAIDIGRGGNQMTQAAHRLGVVLVANNAVAHDAVCAHILGLDPAAIPHLALAAERGFGPLDLGDVDLGTEIPLERLRLRAEGFGEVGLRRVDAFGPHFERVTGAPFPLDIRAGTPHDDAGDAGVLLDWLYTAWDHPDYRERMKRWPPITVFVGDGPIDPGPSRVVLVGDRAVAAFRAQVPERQTWLAVPGAVRRALRGPRALVRYRMADGRSGWAVEIPGDPPSHRDLILGFFLGSFGRLRASMMRLDLLLESYFFGALGALRRRRRNREGIPVVHARKIPRLASRPWRRRWQPVERLARRPELPALPEPPA